MTIRELLFLRSEFKETAATVRALEQLLPQGNTTSYAINEMRDRLTRAADNLDYAVDCESFTKLIGEATLEELG